MSLSYLTLEESLLEAMKAHIKTFLSRLGHTVTVKAGAQLTRPFKYPTITLSLFVQELQNTGGMNYYSGDEGDATQAIYCDVGVYITANTDESSGKASKLSEINSLLTTVVFSQQKHSLLADIGAIDSSFALNNEADYGGWWQKQYVFTARLLVTFPSVTL